MFKSCPEIHRVLRRGRCFCNVGFVGALMPETLAVAQPAVDGAARVACGEAARSQEQSRLSRVHDFVQTPRFCPGLWD